jgi:hypothetical protein
MSNVKHRCQTKTKQTRDTNPNRDEIKKAITMSDPQKHRSAHTQHLSGVNRFSGWPGVSSRDHARWHRHTRCYGNRIGSDGDAKISPSMQRQRATCIAVQRCASILYTRR